MTFTIIRAATTAAVVLTLAGPSAHADERPSDNVRSREISTAYGDCVVGRYPAEAADAVLNDLSNVAISDRYRRLNNVSCMSEARTGRVEGLRFAGDSFRYMLAEGLVRLHYPSSGPADFSAVPALTRPPIEPFDEAALLRMSTRRQEEARSAFRAKSGLRVMAMLGECVARRDPEGTRSLAQTQPASAEEAATLARIQPAIARCLPEGTTVRFNRAVVRGSLLVNYYRLARAVQPPPAVVPAR